MLWDGNSLLRCILGELPIFSTVADLNFQVPVVAEISINQRTVCGKKSQLVTQ
jgi:hypothetical protein